MNAEGRGVPVVSGPLAGYEAAFRAHLSRSGYAPASIRHLVRVMACASCWLEDRELTGSALTPPLAADLAAGLPGAGPLLRFLREAGVVPAADSTAGAGPAEKEAKTRIVHLKVGGEGFTFLGFHHQMVRSPARSGKRQVTFLARWPADKAMQHARDRLRELTDRSRLRVPIEWVVEEMNSFLKGWAAYFRYGNSARRFSQLQRYAGMRLGLFVAKRHRRGRGFGRWVVGVASPDRLGLVSLDGTVVAPQAEPALAGDAECRR